MHEVIDKLSREHYAEKISNEIIQRYESEKKLADENKKENKERDNLIFAISAKWGEGKTTLLKLIEKYLRFKDYEVVYFSPWKYTQKDISLKRAFLKTLSESLKIDKDEIADLYVDSTSFDFRFSEFFKKIEAFLLFGIIVVVVVILFILNNYENFNWVSIIPPIFIFIIIPFIYPLFVKGVSKTKTIASIKSSEQFEEIFYGLLEGKKRIVIFVDDLDRCSPHSIKLVLDTLKTFFQHPECSFIVTGDHTVLEKYAAQEIEVDEELSEKDLIQEGRRYLEKLFDVYWQLPLPTPKQFSNFIENELKYALDLHLSTKQHNNLKEMFLNDNFFERNPRQVKRFIKKLGFALESLRIQKNGLDAKLDKNEINDLNEVINNPNVLAKVFLLDKLVYPIYEKLRVFPQELIEHEKLLREGGDQIDLTISGESIVGILGIKIDGDKIEPKDLNKLLLYKYIVNSIPQFSDIHNTILYEVGNFFLFSGSTGLSREKGLDFNNFENLIKKGSFVEEFGDYLLKASKYDKNKKLAENAIDLFDSSSEQSEKVNILKESLVLANNISIWCDTLGEWQQRIINNQQIQNECLKQIIETYLIKAPELIEGIKESRASLINEFWTFINEININDLKRKSVSLIISYALEFALDPHNNLSGIDYCLNKSKLKTKIESKFLKILNTSDQCLVYLEFSSNQNLSDIKNIVTDQLKKLLNKENDIQWILNNKPKLQQFSIFNDLKEELIKRIIELPLLIAVVNNYNQLEFNDAHHDKIYKVLLSEIKNSCSVLEKISNPTFINKDDRISIFKNYISEFTNKSKRRIADKSAELFLKSNSLWHDIDIQEVVEYLEKLKHLGVTKSEYKKSKKAILDSWSYT